jgi:hypothetical protein
MSGGSDLKGVSLVTFFAPAKKVTRSPQECGSSACYESNFNTHDANPYTANTGRSASTQIA